MECARCTHRHKTTKRWRCRAANWNLSINIRFSLAVFVFINESKHTHQKSSTGKTAEQIYENILLFWIPCSSRAQKPTNSHNNKYNNKIQNHFSVMIFSHKVSHCFFFFNFFVLFLFCCGYAKKSEYHSIRLNWKFFYLENERKICNEL